MNPLIRKGFRLAIAALAFGVDESALKMLKESLPLAQFREAPMEIASLLQPLTDFTPDIIFCGRMHAKTSIVEVAQGVRSMYATAPMYYASSERQGFDRKELLKFGFADAFLMPMDQVILRDLISDGTQDFKTVPLVDIAPDTVLDFDTFLLLPMNRKYIRFSSAGRALEQERVERLHTHQIATVHVERGQMKNFYDFTATQLKKLEQDPAISEAERRSRMQAAIRSLLTGFLGNDSDIQDCSQIVKTYILEGHEGESSWYDKILKLSSGGGDAYTHVSQVSTLAAMFALGLGVGTAEELALAGLLHDIGMADVPVGAQSRPESERSPEERIAYENHPNLSLEILRARKVQLPEKVYSIIAQHHERIDGHGYPAGVKGTEFLQEAQLLAIADHLDYLMRVIPGAKRRSAREALDMVLSNGAYDLELIGRVKALFDPA